MYHNKNLFWGIFIFGGMCFLPASASPKKIEKKIQDLFSGPEQLTFTLRNVKTGEMPVDINSQKNTLPASTQKMITTWVALNVLSPEKIFKTELKYSGVIQKGVLEGDLLIRGVGDPSFGSKHFGKEHTSNEIFQKWYQELRRLKINSIKGCVVPLSDFEDDGIPNRYANFEDIGNYYGGLTSGLFYRDNEYTLHLQGSYVSGVPIAILGTEPVHTGIFKFENYLTTSPKRSPDLAFILGTPLSNQRILKGTYPAGKKKFSIRGSLPHPPYTFMKEFSDFLISQGVSFVDTNMCDKLPAESAMKINPKKPNRLIAEHTSAPLSSIIQYTLISSNNNFSDQLVVLMGKEKGGEASRNAGLEVMVDYLQQNKIPPKEYRFFDGSGLSRKNWISGNVMTRVLQGAAKNENFPHFKKGLLGGKPSHKKKLSKYGKGWQDRLWLKTGYLDGITTFAGYVKGKSGDLYTFYISLNFYDRPSDIRKKIGKILGEASNNI